MCTLQVSTNFLLQYYDPTTGHRLMVPHHLNERKHSSVISDYVKRVLSVGARSDVRGSPWAQLSAGDGAGQPPYKMITYRSLSKATYIAHEQQPTNSQVVETIAQGIPGATCFIA